jgi:hypothetical protein
MYDLPGLLFGEYVLTSPINAAAIAIISVRPMVASVISDHLLSVFEESIVSGV